MHCKISKELSVNGKKCVDGWSPKINHSQVLVLCTLSAQWSLPQLESVLAGGRGGGGGG